MDNEPADVLVPLHTVRAAGWFFDNSLDIFLSLQDDVLKSANATWTALTGWAANETNGRSFWDFVHPDDAVDAEAAIAVLAFGERAVCEHRLATKAGDWLWVRSHVVRAEGAWVLAILRDITAERERERESDEARRATELLREAAHVTIWRYNPDTDEYDLNPDFTRPAVRGERAWKLAGDGVRAVVHRKDAPALNEAWARTIETGEPAIMEYRERRADQSWRHIRAAFQGMRTLASGRWEILGISEDVTVLVEARDAAMRGERAALAAAEAKTQFLTNVSHEIRTPMNGVLGILHLLKAEPSRQERQRLVAEALASGVGLSDLLNDIIDYSDVAAGRLELRPEAVDPAAELDSVVALLRPKALAKGLTLTVSAADAIGCVRTDPARFRKMAFHLVSNAVKFTLQGEIAVRLDAEGEGEGRRLRLEVEDTGIGIAPEAQAALFERFSQGDGSLTRRFGGPGLGLAVTRSLAELMDGGVSVQSIMGEGSTFRVDVSAPACARPLAKGAPQAGWLSGLRVLVVEDNPTNRLVATGMLGQLGAEVETAENGAEGVAAVERGDFDLIFMDIQMPVMDGVEAARRIRAMAEPKGSTPIVATTANVMPEQLADYRRCGINGVIAKPISPSALLAEVARVANGDPVDDELAELSA
jgi:PAS domain S-box-containing protein